MANVFERLVVSDEDGEFISSHCEVRADADGYFISVETDPYEGHAMITLPCAIKVHHALGEAIKAAELHRKQNST